MPTERSRAAIPAKLVLCDGWKGVHGYVQEIVATQRVQGPLGARNLLFLVATATAGELLQAQLERAILNGRRATTLPQVSTVERLVNELVARSLGRVQRADPLVREALLEKSLEEVALSGLQPPFRLRGGLAAHILALHDHIRLSGHALERFVSRAFEEFDVPGDLGAERMAAQTRFLIEGLKRYREKLESLGLDDEATVRSALLRCGCPCPYPQVVALGPDVLLPADLLFVTSIDGIESVEVVVPDSMSKDHRIQAFARLVALEHASQGARHTVPALIAPSLAAAASATPGSYPETAFVARDREEALGDVVRLLKRRAAQSRLPPLDRIAIVVPSPLPYLYLAKKVLEQSGLVYQLSDDFPLAAEPYIAAMDLALDFVAFGGRRHAALGLLRSPFFRFPGVHPGAVARFERDLIRQREPGGMKIWPRMLARWRRRPLQRALPGMEERETLRPAMPVLEAVVGMTKRLAPLGRPETTWSQKVETLRAFLEESGRPLGSFPGWERHERSRAALDAIMDRLSAALETIGDPPIDFASFREKLHRAIESHTFSVRAGRAGVHVVDAGSAGLGSFDLVVLVGLNEGEWPARSERNIFYPQWLLRDFGWPTDTQALSSERAGFQELVRLAHDSVVLVRHQLEEESPTVASPFLEEVEKQTRGVGERISSHDLAIWVISRSESLRLGVLPVPSSFRRRREPGRVSQPVLDPEPISATAFELYLRCPFKHYARHVLSIEEEEDRDELWTPLERGRLLHEILQTGFSQWDARAAGPRPITPETYEEALALFRNVAAQKIPPEKRALEMEVLFGGPGEKGAIEWLLRMEMARGKVRKRLLEVAFQSSFRLAKGPSGEEPWVVQIKGRADRVDIDAEGALHLFDYKSGRAPDRQHTVQVPLYALCLNQILRAPIAEASYLSLREKRSVTRMQVEEVQATVRDVYQRIAEGQFPPRPSPVHLCNTCGYVGLCRKETEPTWAPADIGSSDERS